MQITQITIFFHFQARAKKTKISIEPQKSITKKYSSLQEINLTFTALYFSVCTLLEQSFPWHTRRSEILKRFKVRFQENVQKLYYHGRP